MLLVDGIDITHTRLVDVARLADRARPFYDWVEMTFQSSMTSSATNQQDYLLVVIMAVNWSLREADVLLQLTEKMF
jgi:hypothetical protein